MPIEPWWETNPARTPRQELGMVSPELHLRRTWSARSVIRRKSFGSRTMPLVLQTASRSARTSGSMVGVFSAVAMVGLLRAYSNRFQTLVRRGREEKVAATKYSIFAQCGQIIAFLSI